MSYPEIHHLNLGGHAGSARRGDEFTIGLCRWHHQGQPLQGWTLDECRRVLGPSLKLHSRRFRETFGSDDELLARQNQLITAAQKQVVGR